jgi:hypothetical protein
MKIVTKKDGKHVWVALKDNNGIYHCPIDDSHQSQSLYLAGHLYAKEQAVKVKEMLKKEGHN